MVSAIQSCLYPITNTIPFDDVSDEARQTGIITAEEHEKFREPQDMGQRRRLLVCNIMDKNFETMSSFVGIIGKHNPTLESSIRSAFDDCRHTESENEKMECTFCTIKGRCDIMDIADFFFTYNLISRKLFDSITMAQDRSQYWHELFTLKCREKGEYAMSLMKEFLSQGGQYQFHSDIVMRIDRDLRKGRRVFQCRCQKKRAVSAYLEFDHDRMRAPDMRQNSVKRARPISLPLTIYESDRLTNSTANDQCINPHL